MLSILVVAVALGLSNFAASIAMGLAGIDVARRREIIVTFGIFEAVMPAIGLLLGQRLAASLGPSARFVGGTALVLVGLYAFVQARRGSSGAASNPAHRGRVFITAAALSVDNLVVGFALGAYRVPIVFAASVFAAVSVIMSVIGLEIGRRLGTSLEKWSSELGAVVLLSVGVAIACGVR